MKISSPLIQKKKKFLITDLIIGILFLIFLLSFGVLFVVYFRPLYYADIHLLDLDTVTGLSVQEIKANYNALINYCSFFHRGALQFPSLPSSAQGLSHFAEVKVLFDGFHISALVSAIFLAIGIWYKKRKDQYSYLLISAITVLALPIITALACLINFNAAFVLMHKIFFRNDDWMFHPSTDPIINLLPETFFLHCALVIILILFLGSLILYLCYRHQKNQHKNTPLLQVNRNYIY